MSVYYTVVTALYVSKRYLNSSAQTNTKFVGGKDYQNTRRKVSYLVIKKNIRIRLCYTLYDFNNDK